MNIFNIKPKGYEILKNFLNTKYPRAWKEIPNGFVCDNLKIYYNKKFKEWRITATQFKGMDIDEINYPFDEVEFSKICRQCSIYHRKNVDLINLYI